MPIRAHVKLIWLQLATLLENCIRVYENGGPPKAFLMIVSSSVLVPLAQIFDRYVFNDWDFLGFIMVLFTLDVITGVWKATGIWDETRNTANTFNIRTFIIKASEKFGVCTIWLVLVHITKANAGSLDSFGVVYSSYFGKLMPLTWLIWSVSTNLYKITKGQFPPIGLLKKLSRLNKSGDIKDMEKEEPKNPE